MEQKSPETNATTRKTEPDRLVASPQVADKAEAEKPVFKIQLLVSSSILKADDVRFKGLMGVDSYREGANNKYTYGASTNYNEIYRLRKQILDKFPDAFIVAFKNGNKMDINAAIKEFKANR